MVSTTWLKPAKKCALCANFGRAYPLGGYQIAICETCVVTKQLTAFTTDSLVRLLETLHRELPMQEELPASEDWDKCIACAKGDNTVGIGFGGVYWGGCVQGLQN